MTTWAYREQMLVTLRQTEGGTTVGDICRQGAISEQTFYSWKQKYAGLNLSELRELQQLREENMELKRLGDDLSLDRHMLQEIVRKNLRGLGMGTARVIGSSWCCGDRMGGA
jgi:putative transposase